MIGVSLILGLSGPFGTFESLPLLARITYWGITVGVTYTVGLYFVSLFGMMLPSRWPILVIDVLSGALAGIPVALTVTLINMAWFSDYSLVTSNNSPSIALLLFYCIVIAGTVSVLIGQFGGLTETPQSKSNPVPLLDRLPFEKRGDLVSLQAQDHYVMVTTTKGAELIFMRISDAMKEVGTTQGFQTHRSYWVAQAQITAGKQQGERGILTLTTDDEIPVSRSYLKNCQSPRLYLTSLSI